MKTKKNLIAFFLLLAFPLVSIAQNGDPIPLTPSPKPDKGDPERSLTIPTLYIDGHSLYLLEDEEATINLYNTNDTFLEDAICSTVITECTHTAGLPLSLYGEYIIEVVIDDQYFIGTIIL